MSYLVFISSTREDIELARDLERRLKEVVVKPKVRVYPVEKSATLGSDILSRFKKELREADEVVVLLTGRSVDNSRVISEMGAAFGLNKRVTPVLVNVDEEEIPSFIAERSVKFADLPQYISDLAKRAEEKSASAPA
jgi:hypothetical protein